MNIWTKFTICDQINLKISFAVVESTLISSRIETIARLGAWLCGYKSMQATTFEDPGTTTKVSGATNEIPAENKTLTFAGNTIKYPYSIFNHKVQMNLLYLERCWVQG